MAKVTISVHGVKKVLSKLDMKNKAVRRAIQKEVNKSALNIQYGAKKRCPVRTGALRNSITVDFAHDKLEAWIGPHMPYAAYVEYGTSKMAARPYLFPAFEEERPKFEENLAKAVEGVVEK